MSTAPRVAVIGAGVAGLTAAYRLQQGGARVAVFEARDRVGGRAMTDALDGCRVDAGAQLIGSMYTRLLALLDELGLGGVLRRSPGRDALWRGGRAHEVVYGSVPSMLASGALPLGLKLKLGARYLPFLSRHEAALDIGALERAAAVGLDGESIARWGERELGRDFVDYLAHPQLAAYYGATPEQTSAALYHMLARYGGSVTVHTLPGGTGEIGDALDAAVRRGGGELRLDSPVHALAPVSGDPGGVSVRAEHGEERYDAVVCATPAPVARRLLGDADPAVGGWLEGVRPAPALSLALLLDRPAGVPYFGLSFPPREGDGLAALCVEENKGADLVPPGRGLLVVLPAPGAAAELIDASSEAVLDRLLPAVLRALPHVQGRIRRARVYRWPHGNPVFYPGYLAHLAQRPRAAAAAIPLALAGDYLSSPTLEGAVRSGERAARELLGRLGLAAG